MSNAVVYSSCTGNTKLLAETVQCSLGAQPCLYFGAPDEKALRAKRIYVGFWTDKGTCSEEMQEFLRQLTSQEVFLFGTAGFGGSPEYYDQILWHVRELLPETVRVIGTFMCQGKMPGSIREHYVQMAQAPNPRPNLDLLISNFDRAQSHPDEQDLEQLKQVIRQSL